MHSLSPTGIEITPIVLADAYIARSVDEPGKCAVFQWVSRGRHPVLADGFDTRDQAASWIKYHSANKERV